LLTLFAGGKWIRTISTRKRSYRFETGFCRVHNGSRSRNGPTSFVTADRQVHGDHAARPLLAHREPAQTRYCNPLRGLEVNEAKRQRALEAENAKLKRLLADAMLDNTAVKGSARENSDARRPFPRLSLTPGVHPVPARRVYTFNEVNSKRVYDALSATLTSPRQGKRFDRAVDRAAHRIPVAIRPLLPPRSSVD
jgi:hypothetical protein